VKAARYLGVPPWELERRSTYWRDLALVVESSENWAQNELMKRAQAKGKRRR
jgi:hypothetical protein